MRKVALILVILSAALALVFALLPARQAQALPEYSAQTGEPCATCHVSPSGGGQRGPRGQAWVGSGKPSLVPDLISSLEVLGVSLEVDESAYTTPPETIAPPEPLKAAPGEVQAVHEWLQGYSGN